MTGGSDYCSRPSCYEKDFKITTVHRGVAIGCSYRGGAIGVQL